MGLLSSRQHMGAAALILAASTILSRLMGLIRDKVISWQFGAGGEADMYFAAFVVPDIINYLLAGGFMSITIIPLLSRRFQEDEADAWRFFSCVFCWTLTASLLLTGAGILAAEPLARLVAPGFSPEQWQRLAFFMRIILPAQVFFLCGACLTALLFLRRQFSVPALAPLVYNGCIIAGGLLLPLLGTRLGISQGNGYGMTGYCLGVTVGAALGTFALPLRVAAAGGLHLRPVWRHRLMGRFLITALPLMLGQTIIMLDEQFLRVFGSLAGDGVVSLLNYARRIAQVPVGLMGQAAAVASYPFLVSLLTKGDTERFDQTLRTALRAGLGLIIPCALWMMAAAWPILGVIFQGGRFGAAETMAAVPLTRIMLVSTPLWIVYMVLVRAYYAHGDTLTPAVTGTIMTLACLPLYYYWAVPLGAWAIAALSGASVSELNVTTPESTLITDFTSMLGDKEGSVILTLAYTGPAPVEWLLTYTDSAGGSNSASFTGASTTITGLSLNQKYTFTLESTDGIYLSGATSTQIDVLPLVKISSYSFSEISAQSLTLNWTAAENTPSSWQVTCEAQDFTTVTATVTESTFSTAIPDLSREYKITINAPGMAAPLVCILPANPVVVSGLSASASADGSVQVSWNTLSGAPAGGWYVSYGATTSYHDPAIKDATENAVTLTNLIPDATYKISLQPADGSEVFGTIETTVTTPGTDTMDAYGVSPGNTYISLWEKPSGDSWNYLSLSNSKSTFAADEDIALCLQVSGRNNSTNAVQILYVIRAADGTPVSDASDSRSWNDMWYQLRHTSTVPNPGKAGDYTLEVYVDHALLKRIAFTIS